MPILPALLASSEWRRRTGAGPLVMESRGAIKLGMQGKPRGKSDCAARRLPSPCCCRSALAASRLPSWLSASACRTCAAGALPTFENRPRSASARSGCASSTAAVAAISRRVMSVGQAATASSARGRTPRPALVPANASSSRSAQMSAQSSRSSNRSAWRTAVRAIALATPFGSMAGVSCPPPVESSHVSMPVTTVTATPAHTLSCGFPRIRRLASRGLV